MAIKRQSPKPRRSAAKTEAPVEVPVQASVKPAVRARRAPAKPRVVRSATPAPETYQSGTFMSREEKRQIILAHARKNVSHDPVQIMSMWAGVVACLVVVAVGWWLTVKPELSRQIDVTVKPAMAQSTDELRSAGQFFKDLQQSNFMRPMDTASKILDQNAKVKAQSDALKAMTAMVDANASGTAEQGRDIFAPTNSASPTSD